MSALIRTEIGPFHLLHSLSGDDISPQSVDRAFIPPLMALGAMPTLAVSEQEEAFLRNGRQIPRREVGSARSDQQGQEEVALLTAAGRLLAIVVSAGTNYWQPKIVFG